AALDTFPVQQKAEFMRDFNQINTCGLDLKDAMQVAVDSETSRDFEPTIEGVTVGLSSGTSGNRGLFLASSSERAIWVAAVLQRILGWSFKKRKIAFFLRANSNLYSSVQSNFLTFEYFDLLKPIQEHLERIQKVQPHIVVGQPSLLVRLAHAQNDGRISIRPQRIFSVAEVLSDEDEALISLAFGIRVDQVYQCTEGLFGQTCAEGTLHLNEDWLIVEKEWLDDTRFIPIITDLKRESQPVIRYRMNDILHVGTCTCGSKMQAISRIEGRMDDVLELGGATIFPDFIRRAIVGAHPEITDYQVVQTSSHALTLFLPQEELWTAAAEALQTEIERHGASGVTMDRASQKIHDHGSKLRRIMTKKSG
ncbi:MAG TPA: adenylate synthase, partial [Flavobacteriales bacterium]|nr:adenylate synthase [Flavobacteriales bacterium]